MIEPIRKPTPRIKERKPIKSRPHTIPASVKEAVFSRDRFTCGWCEVPGGALDCHHVKRRSQGGRDEVGNLVAVHRLCHRFIHENISVARSRGFLA